MIVAVAALLIHSALIAGPTPAAPDANSGAQPAAAHTAAAFNFNGANAADNSSIVTAATDSDSSRMNLSDVKLDNRPQPVLLASSLNEPNPALAQNSQSFSTMRVPEPKPGKEHSIYSPIAPPSRRAWIALSIVQHGAAAFDAYSTRQSIEHGGVEDDPLMRPFANSPAIYVATQITPVLLDILARHMQHSEFSMIRRTWWVPQSLGAGVSIFSGVHNLHVANE